MSKTVRLTEGDLTNMVKRVINESKIIMEDKKMDALMFAVNKKAEYAANKMYEVEDEDKRQFWRGQYMAFNEVYSLLKNAYEY